MVVFLEGLSFISPRVLARTEQSALNILFPAPKIHTLLLNHCQCYFVLLYGCSVQYLILKFYFVWTITWQPVLHILGTLLV